MQKRVFCCCEFQFYLKNKSLYPKLLLIEKKPQRIDPYKVPVIPAILLENHSEAFSSGWQEPCIGLHMNEKDMPTSL